MARQGKTNEKTQERGGLALATRIAVASCRNERTPAASRMAAAVAVASFSVAAWAYGQPQGPTQGARPQDVNETRVQSPKQADLSPEKRLAGLLEQEVRLAERLVKAFPDREEPLVLAGSVHSRCGHVDEAFGFWERAVKMNPKGADVYDRMANLALQTDQLEKALSLWRKVLELDPKAPDTHYNMATALMRLGKDRESIEEIHEEAKISGPRPQDYYLLGQAYQHLDEYDKAKENYLRVIALQSDHMNAYYGLYGVCVRLKQPEEAKRYLERFQRLKERQKETLRQADESMMTDIEVFYDSLASFFFDTARFGRAAGRSPDVEEVLRKAMALGQANTVFLIRLARLYSAQNRLTEALALYLKAAQIVPKDVSCQLSIGILFVRMGRFDNAETAFRKAIEIAPEHYGGYQELARLYVKMNAKLPEASRLAGKAVELEARADTYYDLGAADLMNGDPNGALAAINKALDLDPNNANCRQLLEVINKKKGRSK